MIGVMDILRRFWPFSQRFDPVLTMKRIRDPARYEHEKNIAKSQDSALRMKLAMDRNTHQEILYYMAENETDPDIRHAISENLSTPVQASGFMTRDKNADVRLGLAERLVRLLPQLSREEHSQLYAIAVQALGTLAMDEVLKIRQALSSALKDHAYAPPTVVSQLARDVERSVAEPILRFCAALPDDVLLDILKSTPDGWAVEAIAGRKRVSDDVSVAVIKTGDMQGGKILIENPGAEISVELLADIVQRARNMPEWQEPLALRKGLPPDVAQALAGFAQDSVRQILIHRGEFDRLTVDKIGQILKRRLAYAAASEHARQVDREEPYDRAVRMAREGVLDEKMISDALAMREEDFVIAALGCLARASIPDIKRVFALQKARPIVALCWYAGMSMRMALRLQQELGHIPPRELIYPRDGIDYPLTPSEMEWQLEFLGIKAA